PTAGLHFTPELLRRLDVERVTLHVGLDTFRTVTEGTLEEHRIHGERYEVSPEAGRRIEAAERVLAVGTTTTRTLENLARRAPRPALVAELARIREHELRLPPEPARDAEVAARVHDWFEKA